MNTKQKKKIKLEELYNKITDYLYI